MLELGYEILGLAFKEIAQNSDDIFANMIDKVLRGNSSQVELFKNLHNYLWNITHDIEKNKPQPLHSKKIIKLKEIILEKLKEADQKILVFCQMKIITRYLCEYLNRMAENEGVNLKAGYILGKGRMSTYASDEREEETINIAKVHGYVDIYKESAEIKISDDQKIEELTGPAKTIRTKLKKDFYNESMHLEEQKKAVKDFRDNKINVLVATGVVEEGFDIPSCNVVISFDELLNIKSYIQIKGRARMKNSLFYIFAHESQENKWASNFKLYQEALKYMKDLARKPKIPKPISNPNPKPLKPTDLLKKNKNKDPNVNQGEKIEDYKSFTTQEGKCLMNTNWSVDLLAHFCTKLRTKPILKYYRVLGVGYICCIIIPLELPTNLRMICGTLGNTKDSAKKLATFAYCKKLYHNKMLNEHLKVTNFMIKGYRPDSKFSYPPDAKYHENLKKIITDPTNKDLLSIPISQHDPFIGQYEKNMDKFVGYVYSVTIKGVTLPPESGIDIEWTSLAFVYFNEDLQNATVHCKNTNEAPYVLEFSLIDKIEFSLEDYEKYIFYSRFFDATVRGWDINFFEMLTGHIPHKSSIAHNRKKKNVEPIIFSDSNVDGNPRYPFLLAISDGEPDKDLMQSLDSYILKLKGRYFELSDEAKKVSYDEEFGQRFKKDESLRQKKIFQMWTDLRKVYITKCEQFEKNAAGADLDLLEKIYFDDHEKELDDYTVDAASLKEYIEHVQKGRIKYERVKSTFHYELTDYPLNEHFLIHLMFFKTGLEPLKAYLKTLYFQREILKKLEVEAKSKPVKTQSIQSGDLKHFFNDEDLNTKIFSSFTYRKPDIPYKDSSENERQELPRQDLSEITMTENIPTNKIIKALKTNQYDFLDNYDRMEFLGDTVLKMLSTIQVFGDLPEADEDELHTNRARIICNYGLLRMSVKHNIHEYILGIHEVLLPISFMEKKKSEESILNEKSLIIQKEHLKNKNLQQFNKKILADVIESLTGTYYLQYGLEGAQKFLYFTEVLSYPSLYAEIKEIPNTDFSQVKYVMHLKDELTKMFGNKYEIKNMNFFIQALTHASFRKNYLKIYSEKREYVIKIEEMEHQNADLNQETNLQEGDLEKKINQQNEDMKKIDSCLSYQRLEFLGDSILDYYIVSYLFEKYPDNDSGKLTIKKSAIANNKALSLASLKNNLDLLIQINSSTFESWAISMKKNLSQYIKKFEDYETTNDDIHTQDHVKTAADIFEALVGAIYLDSNQNLAKTFEIIDHLYKDIMLSLVDQADKRSEPKLLVLEYCQSNNYPEPEPKQFVEKDGSTYWELKINQNLKAKLHQNPTDFYHTERKLFEQLWKKIKNPKPEKQDK